MEVEIRVGTWRERRVGIMCVDEYYDKFWLDIL